MDKKIEDQNQKNTGIAAKSGLYDPPVNEKDSCGVGFVANTKGVPKRFISLVAQNRGKILLVWELGNRVFETLGLIM